MLTGKLCNNYLVDKVLQNSVYFAHIYAFCRNAKSELLRTKNCLMLQYWEKQWDPKLNNLQFFFLSTGKAWFDLRNLWIEIVNLEGLISIFNGGTFKFENQSLIYQLKLSLLTMTGYERGIKLINNTKDWDEY